MNILSSLLMTGILISGCSFKPALHTADFMGARQPTVTDVQEGLEISIEEFASAKKSRQAFDAEIASYGVLALLLRVENKGNTTYKLSQGSIRAFLDGQPLTSITGELAANQAITAYAGKTVSWPILALTPVAIAADVIMFPVSVVSLFPATRVTMAGMANHTESVNRRIQQHFESLQFTDALLRPNQIAAGFLYFQFPETLKRLEKLTIELKPSEDSSGRELSIKLLVPALDSSGGS